LNADVNELQYFGERKYQIKCDYFVMNFLYYFFNGVSIFDQFGTKFYRVSAQVLTTIWEN